VHIPLPGPEGRKELFKLKMREMSVGTLDFDRLAAITDKYSGSDIEGVCKYAAMMPLNRISFNGDWKQQINFIKDNVNQLADQQITMEDFETAIKQRKPAVDPSI